MPYSLLHVVPPMSAPDFIANSPLDDAAGDCDNLPTSKTGAAIRKQAPVVAGNLVSLLKNEPLTKRYDGYTSCPLITGINKLVLAEFIYENKPAETFPFDQSKERYSMYILKKNFLPILYWKGMLKGIM